jgi:hypothetical protein
MLFSGGLGAGLPLITNNPTYVAPINYNDTTNNTIGGFFPPQGTRFRQTVNQLDSARA